MIKKITTGALALLMAFSIVACGSLDINDTDTDTTDQINAESTESNLSNVVTIRDVDDDELTVLNLNGVWESEQQSDGSTYSAVIKHDNNEGTIKVYKTVNGCQDIYWSGSFTPADIDTREYKWTSIASDNEDKENEIHPLCEDDEMVFHYSAPRIYFLDTENTKYSDLGYAVWFHRITYNTDDSEGDHEEPEPEPEEEEEEETTASSDDIEHIVVTPDVSEETIEPEVSTVEVCVHNYANGITTKSPTCTETGVKTYTCTKCESTINETIPALGHQYDTQTTKQATCGTNGVILHTCAICGDTYETSIPATENHNWQPVFTEATGHYETIKTGEDEYETQYMCTTCGEQFKTSDEATAHVNAEHDGNAGWVSVNVKTADAETETVWIEDEDSVEVDHYECTVCGTTKEVGE